MDHRTDETTGRPATGAPGAPGGAARLILLLGVIVLVGIPFVAVLWETLNALLAGHVDVRQILISLPALLVFLGILVLAGRALGRLDASRSP